MVDLKFEKPEMIVEPGDNEYSARFILSGLETGYGVTIGNSLRRILLSSLRGTAIVKAKIEGAEHEFMALDGVVEDVTKIVLNLKRVIFSSEIKEHDYVATFKVEKTTAGPVLAGDLHCEDDNVYVVNEDLVICNVAEGGKFIAEVTVMNGIGYSDYKANRAYCENIGDIAIDSLFSPVVKVNFNVEKVLSKTGRADNDKLILDIITNGSVLPKSALTDAANILIAHLSCVSEMANIENSKDFMDDRVVDDNTVKLELPIEDLDLSVRSYNCLKRAGIHTIQDLAEKDEEDMAKIRNLGKKSLKEIKDKLAQYGVYNK